MLQSFLKNIFRDAGDPVVLINPDMTIRDANPAFRALVERARDGVRFIDLVAYAARERVLPSLVRAAGGEEVLVEVPHAREDGTETVVEYRFFPVDDGMTAGMGRVRDVERARELGLAKAELRQKARMLDEIQMELTQVPFIDPVTGVWNRLQVLERLTGEWSRSERWGSPIACLMVAEEGIRELRLREGNAVADESLKAVARRIKSVVRDHDIVGRYGDEGFVVLAVHCDLGGARYLGQRILECVHYEPVAVAGRTVQLSVRIGACTNRSEGVEIMEDLFSVALGALNEARTRAVALSVVEEHA
ncbi:MAG: GGDEF domain-containing protein [Planctomycetota bacterium]